MRSRPGGVGRVTTHVRPARSPDGAGLRVVGRLLRPAWLDREADLLLPAEYHHVVFTLPAALHGLTRRQPRLVYELLFQTASATPTLPTVKTAGMNTADHNALRTDEPYIRCVSD